MWLLQVLQVSLSTLYRLGLSTLYRGSLNFVVGYVLQYIYSVQHFDVCSILFFCQNAVQVYTDIVTRFPKDVSARMTLGEMLEEEVTIFFFWWR